ncbi:hypothetical protein V3C99_007170 [Haemonchus contortus]
MHVALLLLSSACAVAFATVEDDPTDIIQETLRFMLDFSEVPNANTTTPTFRASHRIASTMHSIYETFVEDDGSDDGNVVRAIDPALGKLDGHEVLIFDITGLGKEQIMRGELHFYLRRRDATKSGRARQLRAKSLCVNEYCTENQQLETIKVSPDKVIWDATKPLAEANALDVTQLVVRISRRDIRMRRYVELVKKCSPFLVVYSKADNTIDTNTIKSRVDGTRRKRRELGYFSYNSVESTSEAVPTSTERLTNGLKAFRRHSKGKGPPSRRKKVRGNRIKSPEDDIWHGFGDDAPADEEEKKKSIEKSNDVRVVLLGAEEKRAMCQKRGSMVDLKQLGWGHWVIAPAEFETGFCSGMCPTPLPKDTHPSNHALLQTLLKSASVPSVCCSPSQTRSLTIFYRDELGRPTIRNFENMIIESCTCQ